MRSPSGGPRPRWPAPTGGGRPRSGGSSGARPRPSLNAVRAFGAEGLGFLTAKSHARKDPGRVWDLRRDADFKDLLHRRPREFGKATSLWTLALVAEVCHEKGWAPRALTAEAIRLTLKRLGVGWRRAKHWITSPDPEHAKKKGRGTS